MSDKLTDITDESFESEVLKNVKPVLLDFWAPWCGPCKAIGPTIEKLAVQYGDRFTFAKCNVDENPETPAKYGIKSIPCLMFFKEGQMVDQITGMVSPSKIEASINTILSGQEPSNPFIMS